MPTNYDSIDLQWGYTGDSLLGLDGDFADTQRDQILSFLQQMQTVVASEFEDWEEHPLRAAGLDEFVGEANRRDTAKEIEDRIRSSLTINDVINDEDLELRTIPVGVSTIIVAMKAQVAATENNSLDKNVVTTTLLFDFAAERGIVFTEG